MASNCKICGKPITGKAKYCSDCQRQKKREYNKAFYNSNDDYRKKKIDSAKRQQKKQNKLGSLSRYSHHRQKDFDKEYQVVQSMKKKAFKGKLNKRNTSLNNGKDFTGVYKERFHGFGETLAELGFSFGNGKWTDYD